MTVGRDEVSQECEKSVDGPDAICRRNPELCDPDPPLDHRRHRRLQLEDGRGLQAGQMVHVRLDGGDWVFSLVTHSGAGHVGLWFGEPVPTEAAGLANRLAETMR